VKMLLNEISRYIFENTVLAMQAKSRIVIDGFDLSSAKLVSREVNRLIETDPELNPEEFAVRCLTSVPEDLSSEANIEQAVEFRNGNRKLLLFSDDNSAGSLKDFDNRELGQVIAAIEESLLDSQTGAISTKIRAVFSNIENSVSSKQRLEFLVSATVPDATLGLNLWRVGLIPDAGEIDFHTRLAANKRAASAISGRVRPLSSVSERLTAAAVIDPVFRNFLHSHLVTLPTSFQVWLESIASGQISGLTFDLWKISDAPSVEIEKIEIDPFRAKDGSAERACKLVYHALSHELVYRSQVTVSWRATPTNLESVTDWRVEVLPMGADEPTPIFSKNVAYGKRTTLTIKGLGDDEATREFDRYFVRVTAIAGSETLITSGGSQASADSDDFILDPDATDIGTSGTKNLDEWIPEGIIRAQVERGISNIELGASILDAKNQVLVTPLGLSHKIVTPSPQIFSELENFVTEVNPSAQSFSLISRHGGAQSLSDITMENIDVSKEFASARMKFFANLAQAEGNRTSVSNTSWNKSLRKALQVYIEEFSHELLRNPNVGDLLRLDTLKVSVDSSKGKIHGLVLLPFHPLRARWIEEHHNLLMAWVDKINALDNKHRKSQVDVGLIQKISPINVPEYLVLDSGEALSPCIYSGELGGGAALYLPSDELNSGEATQIIRRVLGLKTAGPAGDVSSKAFAKYLTSYVDGRFVEPGLRVCAVNAGDGSVLAAAIETFEKGRQLDLSPLKWNITAYSRAKSFSKTLPALVALNTKKLKLELEAADVRDEHILNNRRSTLLSPSIRVSERPAGELLNLDMPHNISSIQDLANMKLASFAERPERDPILGGLLRPTFNTVVPSASEQLVFASSARPSSDLHELPELAAVTEEFLAAVSKALMGNDKPVAVRLQLSAETLGQLSSLHAVSDWVVTVDRHLGANLYEQELQSAVGGTYVLDYTPDFIDGFGERVTLTTTKKLEMESVIRSAMERLGLVDSGVTASNILDSLSKVSGRLALQLLKDDNRALESMGLAVVITHLKSRNKLENTVIIPVDSHHDIFGVDANTVSDSSERCDLLLLRFAKDGAYELEFVEVKARTGVVPANLPLHMARQTERTWHQLRDLLFEKKNARIDRDLQWSRWNSLLHFYLDRATNSGFVDGNEVSHFHSQIEKISRSRLAPDVSRTGYIVNLDNGGSFSDSQISGMHVRYLNSGLLKESGFTVFTSEDTDFESSNLNKSTDQPEENLAQDEVTPFELSNDKPGSTIEQYGEHQIPITDLSDELGEDDLSSSAIDEEIILGRDSAGQKIAWSKSIAGSPHLVVVGIPGQGKSVLTRKFISSAESSGVPSLVFDFHGDMVEKASSTVTRIDVAESGLPFSPFSIDSTVPVPVTTASGEIAEILESTFGLGLIQKRNIAEALKQAYLGNGWNDQGQTGSPVSMEDFLSSLAQIEALEKNKNASARIQPFTSYQLFQIFDGAEPDFRLSKSLVFDVSRYSKVQEVKLAAGAFILRKIYNDMYSWGMSKEIRVLLVLDEAHLLAKNPTIPKLMKEGRKYGIAMMIVSQSIDDFSPEVPENAGTKIAFRTNFPSSKKVASMLRSRGSADLSEAIENLRVGEAFVSTQGKSEPQLLLPSE
jgi:DNA phosphorothioation-dependent restriction protein DptH